MSDNGGRINFNDITKDEEISSLLDKIKSENPLLNSASRPPRLKELDESIAKEGDDPNSPLLRIDQAIRKVNSTPGYIGKSVMEMLAELKAATKLMHERNSAPQIDEATLWGERRSLVEKAKADLDLISTLTADLGEVLNKIDFCDRLLSLLREKKPANELDTNQNQAQI